MIYTSKKTMEIFKEEIDKFGDAFREDATIETLKSAFTAVKNHKDYKPLSKSDIISTRHEYSIHLKSMYFKDMVFYFDRYQVIGFVIRLFINNC